MSSIGPTAAFFLLSLSLNSGGGALADKREGVAVNGATTGPGWKREEGRAMARCPPSMPFACGGKGELCAETYFKPVNASHADCDGGEVKPHSSCCPSAAIPCSRGKCKSSIIKGQLCPKSHPHVCGKGRKCTFEPWQPDDRSGSDCNGDLHTDAKSCCFYENIDCGDEAAQTCTKNYEYGHLCPSTHPYPCQSGRLCAKSPWKPPSGNVTDCDGKRLVPDSVCCPASDLVPCNGDGSKFKCKPYDPGSALLVLSATFRPANLRRECAGSALPHPRTHQGHRLDHMAMAFFKGNLIACSGRFGSFGWFYKNCYEYNAYTNSWTIFATATNGASHVTALVLDQDTDDEKLFLLGGYNYHWGIDATDQADEYDETTKTFSLNSNMKLPYRMYAPCTAQVDHDRIIMTGGVVKQSGTRNQKIFVYKRSNPSAGWSQVGDVSSLCGSSGIERFVISRDTKFYASCYDKTFLIEIDADSYQAKKVISDLATAIRHPNLVAVENFIYVIGQVFTDGGTSNAKALKYDTVEDKWHTVNQKVLAGYGNPGSNYYAIRVPESFMNC